MLKELLLMCDSGTYSPTVVLLSRYPATLASEGREVKEGSNQGKLSVDMNQWSDTP